MYFIKKIKKISGFTLIETIIYISIFTIISIIVIIAIITMMKTAAYGKVLKNINTSAEVSMERLTREIRLANDIDTGESVFAFDPGVLKLNTTDQSSGSTTTIKFQLSGGILQVSEGGGAFQDFTSSDVIVNSLVFYQVNLSAVSKAIKVEMEIEDSWNNYTKSEKFYNTIILRESY